MGNFAVSSFPKFNAKIETKNGDKYSISYLDVIDHILLLRKVIENDEMIREGATLDYFIKDYCKRMAKQEMKKDSQQLKLPWQIEWIWHVHRLHPLAYIKDCQTQLPEGKVLDKKVYNLIKNHHKKRPSKMQSTPADDHVSFVPSIDLAKAVLRQSDFLQKFQKHPFYSWVFQHTDRSNFETLVQNYILFLKLAKPNEMIVPTFDIDLIWHTHMRCPSEYQKVSQALAGFILDHDDAIEVNVLSNNYAKTADRWKSKYKSDYGTKIDRKHLQSTHYVSSCALVCVPLVGCDGSGYHSTGGHCGPSCGGSAVDCGPSCGSGGHHGSGGCDLGSSSGGGGGCGSHCGGGGCGSHCGGGGCGGD